MLAYCLKWKKNVNTKLLKTKNRRTMLLLKCAACRIKKSKFMKKQEAKGLWSSLDLEASFNKIRLLS